MFRLFGVVFIAASTFGFMYLMLNNYVQWVGLAINWLTPAIVGSFFGLIIAGPFMSVLNIASETIVVCMMVDETMHRPKELRPQAFEVFEI